jgi:group I intron endonuclease
MFYQKPGIYKIQNLVSNKVYVGSSINVSVRITAHKNSLRQNKHINTHLQHSYNKYGLLHFVFQVIEYCSEDELCTKEEYYINYYKSNQRQYGYNLEYYHVGRKRHSEESKQKISKSNKGKRLGYKPTPEEIERIREIGKRPKSIEHRNNISKSRLGLKRKPFSQEWLLKMSNAGSKYWDVYDFDNTLLYTNIKTRDLAKKLNITPCSVTTNYKYKYRTLKRYLLFPAFTIPDFAYYKQKRHTN